MKHLPCTFRCKLGNQMYSSNVMIKNGIETIIAKKVEKENKHECFERWK